ncbi:NADH-quinone oxidoreductase subunit D [Sulfurimonas sp.]|jgi:NADH-quinone oxidoreductase subunit C/D|uniref:NADH-quinone oxidoreductase subunit D n=1 Tax=Sulfurimonas sp. TaxID=2022749 RepID=UPI0025F54844|nr:NADH-quinone oxidoreductase subunit D [Sulfurimonas sp.]MBT5934217.1 NADH-quinone oxidoreductase subunit D [Sulfurimonas sp.]
MISNIITLQASQLFETIKHDKEELGFTFLLDITATDNLAKTHPSSNRFELIYILRHREFLETHIYKVFLEEEEIQSISSLYESADWAEREVYDQYGINFLGHSMLKRLLNHNEFDGHPLRKDYEITQGQLCTTSQDLMDEMRPLLKEKKLDMNKDDLMVINLGPSHPASHGTIRTLAALDGEKIVAAACEIGYLHRGFEKSCENHNYNQIIPYTDRLNYCSALMNNIAFAKTVEDMLDITLPDRGIFIRVMLSELSRIIDHLVCLSAGLLDMGAQTNYWYLFNPRNDAYDFLSKLTGARLTNSFMRIGGMTHDLYDGWQSDLEDVLTKIDFGVTESLKMIQTNRIYNDRLTDISPVSAESAMSYGFTGPNLRASGVPYDLRFTEPHYFYDTFDFNMVVGSVGDTYDRMMVRFDEINESMKIIKQAISRLPGGDVNVSDKSIIMPSKSCVYGGIEGMMNQFKLVVDGVKVPKGEHYGAFEAANGELGFYIVSDGSGTPYKVKVRAPSFYHIAAYPQLIENYQVADAILTLGSLNIIAGEMDR